MKQNQIVRQGDVALQMVNGIPSTAKLRDNKDRKSAIIARGEHSNHSHCVTGECEVFEDTDGTLYVNAKGEIKLQHLLEDAFLTGSEVWTSEHTEHVLPAGTYKFLPQFEYHPYAEEINRVKD